MEWMASSDGLFAMCSMDRTYARPHVVGWVVVEGRLDVAEFKDRMGRRISEDRGRFRRLTLAHRLRLGYLVWMREEHFSIDHHVRSIEESEKTSLQELLGELQCRGFEEGQSPWEVLVWPDEEKTTLIVRWHHCLADGPGMIDGLLRLVLDENSAFPASNIPERFGLNFETLLKLLVSMFQLPTILPWFMLIPDCNRLCIDNPTVKKRIFFSDPLPLEKLKRVAKESACTVNDVFFSCVVQGYKEKFLRPKDTLSVVMPVSFQGKSPEIRNHMGLVRASLPVTLDGDARIREILAMSSSLKASADVLGGWAVVNLLVNVAPTRLSYLYRWARLPCALSNMPLSLPSDARVQGRPVPSLCVFAPTMLHLGMAISLVSAGNWYHFAIMADQSAFKESKDAKDFLGIMVDHVDTLASAAGVSRNKSHSTTKEFDGIAPIIG